MKHPSHVEPCFHAAGGEYVGTTPVTLSPVWSSIVLLTEDADAQDMSAVIRRRGRRIWNRKGGWKQCRHRESTIQPTRQAFSYKVCRCSEESVSAAGGRQENAGGDSHKVEECKGAWSGQAGTLSAPHLVGSHVNGASPTLC